MTTDTPVPADDHTNAPAPAATDAAPAVEPPPTGAPFPAAPPASARTNVLAIVALVTSFFVGLAGIICGAISLSQLKRTGERGRGLAIAGIIVGAGQIAISVVVAILVIVAAAVVGVSNAAKGAVDDFDLPKVPGVGVALDCAELADRLNEGAASLKTAAADPGSDPKATLAALDAFSAELRSAAEDARDPEVAKAVRDAAAEVDDFAAAVRPLAATGATGDPSVVGDLLDHLKSVTLALAKVQTLCTPGS